MIISQSTIYRILTWASSYTTKSFSFKSGVGWPSSSVFVLIFPVFKKSAFGLSYVSSFGRKSGPGWPRSLMPFCFGRCWPTPYTEWQYIGALLLNWYGAYALCMSPRATSERIMKPLLEAFLLPERLCNAALEAQSVKYMPLPNM